MKQQLTVARTLFLTSKQTTQQPPPHWGIFDQKRCVKAKFPAVQDLPIEKLEQEIELSQNVHGAKIC